MNKKIIHQENILKNLNNSIFEKERALVKLQVNTIR
jgi:uncharacterized coiled-coil protein SlyX